MAAQLVDGPKAAAKTFLFAHGAGAPMDSRFMQLVADGVAASGVRVVRFEFPYMQRRRETGKRGAPDQPRVLMQSFRDAIEEAGGSGKLVIGGKSMGGRIASMVADDAGVLGLVCLGYPFHPPGRLEKTRTSHLESLRTPALILQGTRDSFGSGEDVRGYKLSKAIRIEWIEDGDHSFKPRARSGRTEADNVRAAIALVAEFIARA
ncbi:MAG: alpha/beta fold hydrolase [Candidatus Binatus sp.]|uniref:alpha/beta fold hydrolase n=1 Tax=Candidatus Binatus sp. TaxID=2811406 RepID=UPI003BB1D7F8